MNGCKYKHKYKFSLKPCPQCHREENIKNLVERCNIMNVFIYCWPKDRNKKKEHGIYSLSIRSKEKVSVNLCLHKISKEMKNIYLTLEQTASSSVKTTKKRFTLKSSVLCCHLGLFFCTESFLWSISSFVSIFKRVHHTGGEGALWPWKPNANHFHPIN